MSAPTAGRHTDPGEGARRRRAMTTLIAVGVVLVLAAAADLLLPPDPAPAAARVPQEPAAAGTWYCPSVAEEGGWSALHLSAVGDQPSQVVVERYAKGRAAPDKPITIEPGAETVIELAGEDATAPVAVRWSGGAAAAVRRVYSGDRAATAACEPAPAPRWYVPGYATTLGSKALLHLFNPYTTDAVVRLLFATPEGPVALVVADNILVGAGGTTTLNLAKFQPEMTDLGVIVEVLAGRVVAQGELSVTPPPRTTGAAGRLLLPAASQPSEQWVFAEAADDENTESWLSVLNPGEDAAAVEIRVSDPKGEGSSLLGEVSVPPGGLSRIELAGASDAREFGVWLNVVNGEPVVATRLTSAPRGGRPVLTGGAGAAAPSHAWALMTGGSVGRAATLSIYNPGPDEALVDVRAAGAPAAWTGIAVAPNTRTAINLADSEQDLGALPVVVQAQAPVVAELRVAGAENPFDTWQTLGVPAEDWIGATSRPPVRVDPLLGTRVGRPPQDVEDPLGGFTGVESAPTSEAPATQAPPPPPPATESGG